MDDFLTQIQSDEFADDYEERERTQEALNRAADTIRDYRADRAWIDRQITLDVTV
jgi:hypothetical protein